MIIQPGKPDGSGLLFSEDFRSRQLIQSRGGSLVGCTVGNGISPTAASSRVTFAGTENVGIYSSKQTIAVRFRNPSVFGAGNLTTIAKTPSTLADNQWMLETQAIGRIILYVANGAADVSQYAYPALLTPGAEYVMHVVYDGAAAAANRIVFYVAGQAVATTIVGTIPTSMRASASPITVFQRNGGSVNSPPHDFLLRSARICDKAWSAEEVLDDYQQDQYSELWGGG